MTKEELQEGIDFSIENQGIAYTYRNEIEDENGKPALGDEILLNPMNVKVYSKPMAIYDEDKNLLIAIGDQPLVFTNMIKAEGALCVVELEYPDYVKENRLVIKPYDKDSIIKDLKSPIAL